MTLPQGGGAHPRHHHHQAGQVRGLVRGQAGQDALVAGQLCHVVTAHWQQLL